jgi:predicted acylesterase/phospholipase RssA
MKALFAGASPVTEYKPLHVDIFSGTSVGAFNAACVVGCPAGSGLEAVLHLERIWLERIAERPGQCGNGVFRIRGNPSTYLDLSCLRQPALIAGRFAQDTLTAGRYLVSRTANFLASSASLLERAAATIDLGWLVDSTPFHHLVRDAFIESDVRNSRLRLNLVATNWSTGDPEYFTNADFEDGTGYQAVSASAAIPGVFPPVSFGNQLYVDGGVVDNTPLNTALKSGATELHVVYLDPKPELIPLLGEANSIDTLLRVYYLMLAGKLNEDIETARWINDGLLALQEFEADGNVPASASLAFGRVAAKLLGGSYQLATVHRYFPRSVLGGNFGMLDYQLETIAGIIREGEDVAITHDCEESGCLVPQEV